jgi:uncharacterized membrane protein
MNLVIFMFSSIFKKLFFLAIYLGIDAYYVIHSHPLYQQTVYSIANHDMPTNLRQMSILYAYGSMALGWLFLAIPTAERWSCFLYRPFAGLLAGAVYGIALIGTFNFTLNLMFEGWSGSIMIRDLTWGICWTSFSVFLYTIFHVKKTPRRYLDY